MNCHVTSTLGPSSESPELLEVLISKSDRIRINTAFVGPQELVLLLDKLEKVFKKLEKIPAVVLDLQGAKMRIGQYTGRLKKDLEYKLVLDNTSSDPHRVPVPHVRLFSALNPGDRLSFNDNRLIAQVHNTGDDWAIIKVEKEGQLLPSKGINRMEHPIDFFGLEERDKELIVAAGDRAYLELAYSFVHTGEEAEALKTISSARRIAKIERPEAFKHLKNISREFQELWLCRGDLGAQAGLGNLRQLQEEFANVLKKLDCPLILAGQVLEHMSHFPEPTRAEVVQLHQALTDGFQGVVFSDETAVGKYVVEVLDLISQVKSW